MRKVQRPRVGLRGGAQRLDNGRRPGAQRRKWRHDAAAHAGARCASAAATGECRAPAPRGGRPERVRSGRGSLFPVGSFRGAHAVGHTSNRDVTLHSMVASSCAGTQCPGERGATSAGARSESVGRHEMRDIVLDGHTPRRQPVQQQLLIVSNSLVVRCPWCMFNMHVCTVTNALAMSETVTNGRL